MCPVEGKNDPCWVAALSFVAEQHRVKETRNWAQFSGQAKQHIYSFKPPWYKPSILQNRTSAVSTKDRDYGLLFITRSYKRNLCSMINKLPDLQKL